jgi:hypothetical protein
MKTFLLTIFKGHEVKIQKTVTVENKDQLEIEKNIIFTESPYSRNGFKIWLGVKRIK